MKAPVLPISIYFYWRNPIVYSKLCLIVATCVSFVLFNGPAPGDAPELDTGVYVNDSGGPIDVDAHLIPCCVDWNEDGAKDLLIGQYTNGHIHLYLNQGSDFAPLFTSSSLLEAGGSPIVTSFG